jgi:hypothetical protein
MKDTTDTSPIHMVLQGMSDAFVGTVQDLYGTGPKKDKTEQRRRWTYLALLVIVCLLIGNVLMA